MRKENDMEVGIKVFLIKGTTGVASYMGCYKDRQVCCCHRRLSKI